MLVADSGALVGGLICLLFFYGCLAAVAYSVKKGADGFAVVIKGVLTPVFEVADIVADGIKEVGPKVTSVIQEGATQKIEEAKEEGTKLLVDMAVQYLSGGSSAAQESP